MLPPTACKMPEGRDHVLFSVVPGAQHSTEAQEILLGQGILTKVIGFIKAKGTKIKNILWVF